MGGAQLKIVQVCGWYFPESLGGTETYVAALAEHLRDDGHEVLIAAPVPGGEEQSYEHAGVPVFRYPIAALPTRREARHEVPVRGAERLHAWLDEQRPDVVHVHTLVTGIGPHEILAAKSIQATVVVTTHAGGLGFLCQRGTMARWGSEVCDGVAAPAKCAACELQNRGLPRGVADLLASIPVPAAQLLDGLPGRLGTTLGMPALIAANQERQQQMMASVDAFVVLTEWARRAVSAAVPTAPVVVNRLGIRTLPPNATLPRPSHGERPVTVAYLGRFDAIKGVHDLAHALRAIPREAPLRVEFRGPWQSPRDRAVANDLHAILLHDPRVTFGDAIAPEQIYDYLRTIDLLCCPSRTLEGGPTVALEAMAVGTPVLATRLGAMAEIIDSDVNGLLVPPMDVPALAAALERIAHDRDGTLERWTRALPVVRTMRDVARDYVSLYSEAGRSASRPAVGGHAA
jgi:glycosyltransferase involved in cell wall biosynthesis